MLSFKPRQMTEVELIKQLSMVLEQCESEDFKSKRFVGLLNDYIPYQNGLKVRLELLGRSGTIDQMRQLKKESNHYAKLEKLAVQFSKEYGFVYEEILASILIVAKALALNTTPTQTATLKIVSSVQGNFSKKHIAPITETGTVKKESAGQIQPIKLQQGNTTPVNGSNGSNGSSEKKYKKKFIRSKSNLFLYLALLFVIPLAYYGLNESQGIVQTLTDLFSREISLPVYSDPWVVGTLLGTGAWIVLVTTMKWGFKKNIVYLLPMAVALLQAILITFGSQFPDLYIGGQVMIGVSMWLSFAVMGSYSMRLPKGAKEFLSYKAIVPYYLSVLIWLVGQYWVIYK